MAELLSCRTATIRFLWSKYIGNHINILITDQCVQKNPKKPVFFMKIGPKIKNGGLLSCRTATIRFFWSKYIGSHINIHITDQCVQKTQKTGFLHENRP